MPSGASALKYGSRIPTNWRSLKKQINAFSFVEINKLKENINKRVSFQRNCSTASVEGVREGVRRRGYGGGGTEEGAGEEYKSE